MEADRCVLTTDDEPATDITESADAPDLARRLLAAAMGEADDDYNTAASLASARLLIEARESQRR